jgi:hypothetical protein
MKTRRLLPLLALLLCGCPQTDSALAEPPPEKVIASKHEAVESEVSGAALILDGKIRPQPVTRYHLFAEDGTYVTVDLPAYARTRVGDKYAARHWSK